MVLSLCFPLPIIPPLTPLVQSATIPLPRLNKTQNPCHQNERYTFSTERLINPFSNSSLMAIQTSVVHFGQCTTLQLRRCHSAQTHSALQFPSHQLVFFRSFAGFAKHGISHHPTPTHAQSERHFLNGKPTHSKSRYHPERREVPPFDYKSHH